MNTQPELPRIIVIDDDPIILETIHNTLTDLAILHTTTCPQDALNTLAKLPFDIFITDQIMPDVTGIELMKKAQDINPDIIPVIITANANKESAIDALKNGAYDFIEKPISPIVLIKSISRIWDKLKTDNHNNNLINDIKATNIQLKLQNQELNEKNEKLAKTEETLNKRTKDLRKNVTELLKAEVEIKSSAVKAGMAEVATNILHNVGNVLNSVNVSTSYLLDLVKNKRSNIFHNIAQLLTENKDNLNDFLINHPKGKLLPLLLIELSDAFKNEDKSVIYELNRLSINIDHIKTIITLQQNYADKPNFLESCSIQTILEDALRMVTADYSTHDLQINLDIQEDSLIVTSRHKLLQVIINLLRNARESFVEYEQKNKKVLITLNNNPTTIKIIDNGVGILKENMEKMFSHGFTTKKDGHGFGLHSCYMAIKELGGEINVSSDGLQKGTSFTIILPEKVASGEPQEV
ncbi:MAG: hypothetical protein COA79_18215 [Planctomycetota bacterium]|nr:MAG: hypothetical protein COA79_18215 [Planctomycetota bacterium]